MVARRAGATNVDGSGPATQGPLPAHVSLATNALFRNQLGAADATERAARALLFGDAAAAWATAAVGAEFTPELRARIRATTTWAAAGAASVVDLAYRAAGGSAIYSDSPLQRRFRDIHALTQHFLVKLDTLTTAGAVLAGGSRRALQLGPARLSPHAPVHRQECRCTGRRLTLIVYPLAS